jgi:hypothetical protein
VAKHRNRWIWIGRAVAVGVVIGLAVYLFAVGLNQANAIAAPVSVVIALAALLAPLLLPAYQSDDAKDQQAKGVDLEFDPPFNGSPVPQNRPLYAVVTNKSDRPIRNVFCGIPADPENGAISAAHWTIFDEWPIKQDGYFTYHRFPGYQIGKRSEANKLPEPGKHPESGATPRLELIRSGERIGFSFNHDEWQPEKTVVQFTDDAGLSWQINSHLHLQSLPPGQTAGDESAGP